MISTPLRIALLALLPIAGSMAQEPPPVLQNAEPSAFRSAASPARPRLVVVISIDQFRADYVQRWRDLFDSTADPTHPRGFRELIERGAWYSDAHHDSFPLFTGPGHAVIVTGAPTGISGIIGNEWGDPTTHRTVYCVSDPNAHLVGTDPRGGGISPRSLLVSTIGDELKMATGGEAKVWGLAVKDRAAVLMAGHLADGAVWLDATTGHWTSSDYYFPGGTLPAWATETDPAKDWQAHEWRAPIDAALLLQRTWLPDNAFVHEPFGLGRTFPHALPGDPSGGGRDKARYLHAYIATPKPNSYVLQTAERLIQDEGLGADDVPDLLAINLSSNDYLGHAFGPDSPEVMAMTIETDRALADFMDHVAARVAGGWTATTLVVTADHGVVPIPEAMQRRFSAGRYDPDEIVAHIDDALASRLKPDHATADATKPRSDRGAKPWTSWIVEQNVYLDHDALACPVAEAAEIAAEVLRATPGIAAAFTRDDILHGRMPPTAMARRVANGYHDGRNGDVVFVQEPYWLPVDGYYSTSHGTPYAYDTSVPIFFAGCGVRAPGRYRDRVSTFDIAATLADELGVLQPSGCAGRVLPHAGR